MTGPRFHLESDRGALFAPTHRLTTTVTDPVKGLITAGTFVEYAGQPHYQLQPLDDAANAEWLETTADFLRSTPYVGRSMPRYVRTDNRTGTL